MIVEHRRSLKQPSVYEDDIEVPEPYEAPYVSSYGRAFVKPKKQAPRGEFKGAFPSKPSGASAFTSEYRGAYEPVKGVKAAPAQPAAAGGRYMLRPKSSRGMPAAAMAEKPPQRPATARGEVNQARWR